MAETSTIEWTDATWNPITGCSVVSPGCTNCYAMRLAGGRLKNHPSRIGLTRPSAAGPVWTGETRLNPGWLDQPMLWVRPRLVFVGAHTDLFHPATPDSWLDHIFARMTLAPWHVYQVLTKRGDRMRDYLTAPGRADRVFDLAHEIRERTGLGDRDIMGWPGVMIWVGVSVEDQRRADERRDDLAAVAAHGWHTFASYEPALGPVDWAARDFLTWLISGGENGPRPSHPDWHRAARDFCAGRGVAYLFKQWGSWVAGDQMPDGWEPSDQPLCILGADFTRLGVKAAGRLLDGVAHDGMPRAMERLR